MANLNIRPAGGSVPGIDVFPPRRVDRPFLLQNWEGMTFLHWRYEPSALRGYIPRELALETFDGSAWLGLALFRLTGLRLPGLPAVPGLSDFPETNLLTYVRGRGGAPGIWFFTLEAARLAAVWGARVLYGLPYHWAEMRVESSGATLLYRSRRHWPARPATTHVQVRAGRPMAAGELEAFLTARFRFYALHLGNPAFADVEHEPWPLQQAEILELEQTLVEACGLPRASGVPLAHYSPGVHARVSRLTHLW